ncbi:gamma-glutamyltransferase [Gammaproteobacteria bacterium]|nr:gamma-glutamyltransferase [Gammaproteobacteria bacterium]MDB9900730.1 gamma-glutamyltransferase [Gammaproteobacteria bacterium]MDC1469236.1 gamma-glutamyltransferase [Gammaproteobacteria bacterium]
MFTKNILAALLIGSVNLSAQVSYIDYLSPFHPTIGESGMVVSQNQASSDIGVQILDMGGNAVDAAVAVGFSLAITLPRAGNLGGGGFMLVYLKDEDKTIAVDFRSASPKNITQDDFLFLKNNYDQRRYGYKASGVPGTVAGLIQTHERYGKLPLRRILKPVINQARKGFDVSYDLNQAIGSANQIALDVESTNIYLKDNGPISEHSKMIRKDLAWTINEIAKNGDEAFYEGSIAKKIIQAMNENGGYISAKDLQEYQPRFSEPIKTTYRGSTVYAHPPPAGGAAVLLESLNILENFSVADMGAQSAQFLHLFAEALQRGHMDRSRFMGDPEFYDVPIQKIISKKRANTLAKKINLASVTPPRDLNPDSLFYEGENTTHYSIVDKDGNAVSNTYTLGYSFGSGVTIPGTGILMDNQMNNFAYRFGEEGIIDRSASEGNKFEPGKRPMSTMTPVIVFDENNALKLISGSPGGALIPAAVLRVITGIIDFDLNLGEATMLPRIHKDWPYESLRVEKGISLDTKKVLASFGHEIEESKTMGSTQSILISSQGKEGYADLRRPNAGVAIQVD